MRIEWTDPALDDLTVIRDYIAKDSPFYAHNFIERIFNTTESLIDHPKLGRPVPEAERDDIRELIYQGYRIIYRLLDEMIQVIAVIHGSRLLADDSNSPWA